MVSQCVRGTLRQAGLLSRAIASDSCRENIGLSKLSPDSTLYCKVTERRGILFTSTLLLDLVSQKDLKIFSFLTVDNDESVKKILLHALAIGKYSCDTFSTSFKTISVSSTFCIISDASVFIFSNVAITLRDRR